MAYEDNPFHHVPPIGPDLRTPFNRVPVFSTMGRGPRGEQGERGFPGEASRKDFETVADMVAEESLEAGDICHTLGFHEAGDGGAAWYQVTDDATANGMDIIALDNGMVALYVLNNTLNVMQFGAKKTEPGTISVDDAAINNDVFQYAVDYCEDNNATLYIPIGIFEISETIAIDEPIKIQGEKTGNQYNTSSYEVYDSATIFDIRDTAAPDEYTLTVTFSLPGPECMEIRDIQFYGAKANRNCLSLNLSGWTMRLTNVTIVGYNLHAIHFNQVYDSDIDNLTIVYCGTNQYDSTKYYALCIDGDSQNSNALHFNNLHMEFCRYFIDFEYSRNIYFVNSKFEVNRVYPGTRNPDGSYFLYNATKAYEIGFDCCMFIGRGITAWLAENPLISADDVPYLFSTTGNIKAEQALMIQNSNIISPEVDGGLKFLNDSIETNIVVTGNTFAFLAIESMPIKAKRITFTDNVLRYIAASSMAMVSSLLDGVVTGNRFEISNANKANITNENTTAIIRHEKNDTVILGNHNGNFTTPINNYITGNTTQKTVSANSNEDVTLISLTAGTYLSDLLFSVTDATSNVGRFVCELRYGTSLITAYCCEWNLTNTLQFNINTLIKINANVPIFVKVYNTSGADFTFNVVKNQYMKLN